MMTELEVEDVMAGARKHRAIIVVGIVAVSMLLMGCMLAEIWEEYGSGSPIGYEGDDAIKKDDTPKENQAEPDQALASGEVLSVRVNYGNSGAAQCQVRIENERNGWYDEVEFIAHAGSLGGADKMYDDYPFGSTNFNRQLTQPEYYDPEDAKGDYRITVTADTGYSATATVKWDGERFNPSLISFSLD
jgi:hypothetical protein